MEPIIVASARKHGVSDGDMLHAFYNPIAFTEGEDGFVMVCGADAAGNLIEVGFVVGSGNLSVIIHAMRPCRPQYLP